MPKKIFFVEDNQDTRSLIHLPNEEPLLIIRAALAACGAFDGLKDRLIGDPRHCALPEKKFSRR